jgi:glutathione-regulated potassium-efflux system protein KefB
VLLIGFGRVGQIVSQAVLARGHSLSIIDTDARGDQGCRRIRLQGVLTVMGRALDILHAAGAANASLIIAAGDAEDVTRIAELAKHEFPDVHGAGARL